MARRKCLVWWAGAAGVGLLGAAAGFWWWAHPGLDPTKWRSGAPASWASRQRQEERWREERLDRAIAYHYVPLEKIAIDLQLAVLVGEDINFFGHGPVDFRAVREVLEEWRQGGRLRGASTIAQQLARCLFLSPERSFARKLREWRLAWWLEHELGKRRVLELYLNVVEFGPAIFGAEAAAQHYLGRPAESVDGEGAASLAAAIPAPGRDNLGTASERWSARRQVILTRCARAGWLRARLEHLSSQEVEPREPHAESGMIPDGRQQIALANRAQPQ
jgi:monofunctional glycosyltransferase